MALNKLLERPQEIRLNIFDEDKKNAKILEQEQANFMGVMGNIFEQIGIQKPNPGRGQSDVEPKGK